LTHFHSEDILMLKLVRFQLPMSFAHPIVHWLRKIFKSLLLIR